MTQYDLQADVETLKKFATAMGGTTKSGSAAGGLAGEVQALPNAYSGHPLDQVNFGQTAHDGSSTGFTDAENLLMAYQNQHRALIAGSSDSSLNTFVSQLNALADAAATIAQRYQNAQTEDTVSASDVDNALNSVPGQ